MADANSKLTILFEATGGTAPTGWTETWWSAQTDLGALLTQAKAYVKTRAQLLGVGAVVQFARASLMPLSTRISEVYFFVGKEGQGSIFTNQGPDDHDPTQVDLLIRLDATPRGRRQLALSGLPDSVTDQLLDTGVQGAFTASPAYKQWVASITANGLGMRVKNPAIPGTFNLNTISKVTPIMVRNRKRGRPFELFRGRRLA